MKRLLAAPTLLALMVSPVMACNEALFARLDAPPGTEPGLSIDATEIGSTEGGEWQIWPDVAGTVEMVRVDYGEMGRLASRLVVIAPDAYAIATTEFSYSAPIYVSGSSTIRQETDIFVFCAGRLHLPDEGFRVSEAYAAKAAAALAVFDAPEIAEYLPEMMR